MAYKFIKIRAVIGSDIARCEDENNPIMKYESCFPFVASLRQRTSRLGFAFYFHIDGYWIHVIFKATKTRTFGD